MKVKNKIKHIISFLLHGEPKPVFANISYTGESNKLLGKKIIITGGGSGLGFAMAQKFLSEGADVIITGRDKSKIEKSANQLGCKFLILDVTNIREFNSFIEESISLLGDIDCLINNAGVSLHEDDFLSVTAEQFDIQFDTNLKGPFFLTQSFISRFKYSSSDKVRKVFFISSETAMTADDRPYGLTKVSLNSLVQGLSSKFIKDGFRINAIAPGITSTNMTGIGLDGNLFCGVNPTNRVFLPEEIAEIACFLCMDASNIINGQIIYCNEGRTINTRW